MVTCWTTSGASVPMGTQGAVGSGGTQGGCGVWGYPEHPGGLLSLLGDSWGAAARAVTVKGEVTSAAVTGICHEQPVLDSRIKVPQRAGGKNSLSRADLGAGQKGRSCSWRRL